MQKQLPKSIHDYLNPSHLGESIFFNKIINDSKDFTLDDLQQISSNNALDVLIRASALYMLGSMWNMTSLIYVGDVLSKDPTLIEYTSGLFSEYSSNDAKDFIKKLLKEKIISESKAKFIVELIDENIKYNRDPVKKWGRAVFKEG